MLEVSVFILLLQTGVTGWLFYELITLPASLPSPGKTFVQEISIDVKLLEEKRPVELLKLIYARKQEEQKKAVSRDSQQLRLLNTTAPRDKFMNALFWDLNLYFIHTHFTAPDIAYIKEMVNERTNEQLQKIRLFLFMPIALGLFDIVTHSVIEKESGWGIFFGFFYGTVLSIVFVLRTNELNDRKRAMMTSIQSELLLPFSAPLKNVMLKLHDELNAFGKNFAKQVVMLGDTNREIIEKTHVIQQQQLEAITRETEQLRAIAEMDFQQIVRFNTEMLEALRKTMADFGTFAHVAADLTGLIQSMEKVTHNLNQGLSRTEKVEAVADVILETVQRNSQLQEFLTANMKVLAERKEFLGHIVGGVDVQLAAAFSELRDQIVKQVNAIKTLAIHEQLQLEGVIKNGAIKFEKLNKLDELSVTLAAIREQNEILSETLQLFGAQFEQMNRELQGMHATLRKRRFWFGKT
jgi:hypothetical protein